MFIVLKLLICALTMAVGVATGAVAAFYLTVYSCEFYDWIRGAKGGNGIVILTWLFCYITVPLGCFYGGYYGIALGLAVAEKLENRESN